MKDAQINHNVTKQQTRNDIINYQKLTKKGLVGVF